MSVIATKRYGAACLLAIALLLAVPYTGIRHDSILYLGQALTQFRAPQLGQDLFFAFGSQARFTLFPQLVGALTVRIPSADLFLAGTLLGRFLFLIASWLLLLQLMPKRLAYLALLVVVVMPGSYGREAVFSYSELFFTGRTLAEPLVLLALAAMVKERWAWMGLAWLGAALLHPLQALPGSLLIFLWLATTPHRRWLWVPIALAAIAMLVLPADTLLSRYDEQWWTAVVDSNPMVLLTRWSRIDQVQILIDLFFCVLVWRRASGVLRRFAGVLSIGAALSFVASGLLADLLHLVLPTGLQLWRAQWLLHWLAIASLPWLFYSHFQSDADEKSRTVFLLLIALISIPVLGTPPETYGVSAALVMLYALWPRLQRRISRSAARTLVVTVTFAAILIYGLLALEIYHFNCTQFACDDQARAVWLHPLMLAISTAAVVAFWVRASRAGRGFVIVALLGLCVLAGATWDSRSAWTKALETAQPRSIGEASPFGEVLEPEAQVLWIDGLMPAWLSLQRPSFLTRDQFAGLLFNRGTFVEAYARQAMTRNVKADGTSCSLLPLRRNSGVACDVNDQTISALCKTAQGTLNYVVLQQALNAPPAGRWVVPAKEGQGGRTSYFLYRCASLIS